MKFVNENYHMNGVYGVCGIYRMHGMGSTNDTTWVKTLWKSFDDFMVEFFNAVAVAGDGETMIASTPVVEKRGRANYSICDMGEELSTVIEVVCRSDQFGFEHMETLADLVEATYYDIQRGGYYLRMYLFTFAELRNAIPLIFPEPEKD